MVTRDSARHSATLVHGSHAPNAPPTAAATTPADATHGRHVAAFRIPRSARRGRGTAPSPRDVVAPRPRRAERGMRKAAT